MALHVLDRFAYALTLARLWLSDLVHGPEPMTSADERREAERARLRKAFPVAVPEDRKRGDRATRTTYLLGCDLGTDRNYGALKAAIDQLGDARQCLETAWLLSSENTAVAIREYLSNHLADGDKIFVIACGRVASWGGFDDEFNDWLKRRI